MYYRGKKYYLKFSSSTFHRVGFTCARLPIGKDSAVVALQNLVDYGNDSLVKQILLHGSWPENLYIVIKLMINLLRL